MKIVRNVTHFYEKRGSSEIKKPLRKIVKKEEEKLKTARDKKFFKLIEKRSADDNYEVNAVIGEIKKKECHFQL